MRDTDDNPAPDYLWLLVGGSLVLRYALGHRAAQNATSTAANDDFSLAKAEIAGFLIGTLCAIIKRVVMPSSPKSDPVAKLYDQSEAQAEEDRVKKILHATV